MQNKVEKMKFLFRLGEGEPNPLQFTYNGKNYVFYDGQEYNIPIDLAEHLNSLKIPEYAFLLDERTGQRASKIIGYKHRFFLIPADLRKTAEKQKGGEQNADDGQY